MRMNIHKNIALRFYNFLKKRNNIGKNVVIPNSTKISGSIISSDVSLSIDSKIINCNISGKVQIGANNWVSNSFLSGNIEIGESCKLHYCHIEGFVTFGRYSSIWGPNTDLICSKLAPINIGNFCSIARNVSMQSFNHNPKKATTYFIGQNFFKEKWENEKISKGMITIENDVWIGSHCIILGGVTISNGAVVAANSVVTKDVEAYSIVAGSPAKVIGYRFSSEIIKELLEIQWWNWNDEQIKKNKLFFERELTDENINVFKK